MCARGSSGDQGLKACLAKLDRVVVALSGGVDSSLVAWSAYKTLGNKARAVTVRTEFTSYSQMQKARSIVRRLGIRHEVRSLDLLHDEALSDNGNERCYFCKKALMGEILGQADKNETVLDGTNADDDKNRPGRRALSELGVVSPLEMCGLGKTMIRSLSRARGLANWDEPSDSCLATRVPLMEKITARKLRMIEEMEDFLRSLGLSDLRARCCSAQRDNDLKVIVETPREQRVECEHVDGAIRRMASLVGFSELEYGDRR